MNYNKILVKYVRAAKTIILYTNASEVGAYHKFVFAIKVYNVEACNLASTIHFGQVLAHSTHTMEQCQCLKIQ